MLDEITRQSNIFDAWSDEPWVVDGVAVRVSLLCFGKRPDGLPIRLDDAPATHINADLTRDTDLTTAKKLPTNREGAFIGGMKKGRFDIPGDLARQWLTAPANPNGRTNADVLKPWMNGMDVTRRPAGKWIIDFGQSMTDAEAAMYEGPFAHVVAHVKPKRDWNNRDDLRRYWWRHDKSGQTLFERIAALPRYIATARNGKHRVFDWLDSRIRPDGQLVVIARDNDTTFGILHSRFHETWSLRLGTEIGKGNDPRYTPTTTFETFPFPEGLSPDIPAKDYEHEPRARAIADAARRLGELRERWLNPPEWIEWIDEPAPGYPKRAAARNAEAEKQIKKRTLTKLYNTRPQWLVDAHNALDATVARAYGWDPDITDDDALQALLNLNCTRTT